MARHDRHHQHRLPFRSTQREPGVAEAPAGTPTPGRTRRLASELTDAELLTELLGPSTEPGCRKLTTTYENLRSIATLPPAKLLDHGFTSGAVDRLHAIFEIARRYGEREWPEGNAAAHGNRWIAPGRHSRYISSSMRRRLVQGTALAALALSLAIGLLPRLALCVGPGGHSAIEPLNAACCDAVARPRGGPAVQRPQHGCAAGCIDTPLSVGLSLAAGDRSDRATLMEPLIVAPVLTPPLFRQAAGRLLDLAPAALFEPPPRSRRTSVNLC